MKNRNTTIIFFAILIGIVTMFSSCRKCVEGKGSTITENRIVTGTFTGLISDGTFDFDIFQDTSSVSDSTIISINTYKEILPYISVEVVKTSTDTNLLISMVNKYCLKFDEAVVITIHVPKFSNLEIDGSTIETNIYDVYGDESICTVTGSATLIKYWNLNCTFSEVEIAGDGEVELVGIADNTNLKITGSGDIDALYLQSKRCTANISGSGVMNIWISKQLDAVISGDGTIYYKAEPGSDIFQDITGLGELTPLKK